MTQGISPDVLVPYGKVLLLGSLGYSLVQSMRGTHDFASVFERVTIGLIGILFFKSASDVLLKVSDELTGLISDLGSQQDLKALIFEALQKASKETPASGNSTSFNLPAVIEQAWRTGVWGVMAAIVDGVFLISSFVLECARDVFWKLLLFLFPVACGVYPIFPRMMLNQCLYAVELALWFPVLTLVQMTTGIVAQEYMQKSGSLGLYVVAVELLAILLILLIPSVTHRFLSGAFSGDFDSQAGLHRMATRAVVMVKTWGTKML